MDTVLVAATAMSMVINGLPVTAYYLKGVHEPCDMARATAKEWRRHGKVVVQSKAGEWCTVGMVRDGEWIAQQWRSIGKAHSPVGRGQSRVYQSEGWRTHIPIAALSRGIPGGKSDWDLDVIDRSTGTRIQFRQGLGRPASNAQLSGAFPIAVRSFGSAGLWVDGLDFSGGQYAIAIQRGVVK